jgi:hypothetical protein
VPDGFDAGSIFVALRAQLDDFNKGIASAKDTLSSLGQTSSEVTVAFTELDTSVQVFTEIETAAPRVRTALATVGAESRNAAVGFQQQRQAVDETEQAHQRSNFTLGRSANRILSVQLALITLSQHAGPFRDLFQGISNGVSTAAASMQLFGDKLSLASGGLIAIGVAIESFLFRAWEDAIKAQDEGTDQLEKSTKRIDELKNALEDAAKVAKVFGSTYGEDLSRKLSLTEAEYASNLKRLREISAEIAKLNSTDPGLFGSDRTDKISALNLERTRLSGQQDTIQQTGLFDKQFAAAVKITDATKAFNKELENTEIVGQKALQFGVAEPAEIAAKSLSDARSEFDRLILDNAKLQDEANKYGLTDDQRNKILARLHSFDEIQSAADKERAAKAYNDQVKAVNDLASTFSTSVGDGLRDALINAKKPMEALASIGQNLFANMVDQTIKRLETGLTEAFKAITGVAGEGIGLALTGILGAAGAVLSKLGSKGSDSFGSVQSAVTSSQAVRGIVAGPSSVAIATVSDDLARAVAPVVQRLDMAIGYLASIDRKTGSGGRGGIGGSNVALATP